MSYLQQSPAFIQLKQTLISGRALIQVRTLEENRLSELLTSLAESKNQVLWTWSAGSGLACSNDAVANTETPEAALQAMLAWQDRPMVWMKDLHHHYSPLVIRLLRDLYYRWSHSGGCVVISAPERAIVADLERETNYIDLGMPGLEELVRVVEEWSEETGVKAGAPVRAMAATLKGLTLNEARHALHRLSGDQLPADQHMLALQEEKKQLIAKMGTLEFIPKVPAIEDLGGLENLKDWLGKRKELILAEDEGSREITPKGILLMGVSGCGKSLCIKAISSAWQLPLYRLEMVRVFSGAYGSPELAFADACRVMEKMAPAILWIDEIEMGLSAEGSSAADTVMSRIFAFFLTWMQEKPPGLFVAASANRIDLLPAEMIRKGRFDQVFFVDLPTVPEREDIFRIHLERRGYDPEQFNLSVFADGTEGWNGAEIEQCVISAITAATMEQRELTLKDLYASRKQIVPISQTMEEQVRHIRNWAHERAVRASKEA